MKRTITLIVSAIMAVSAICGATAVSAYDDGVEITPNAWLRFFRDEAMSDEYASVADIAAGERVYFKVESDAAYYCTHVDIKCPTVDKNAFYADRPGSEIEYKIHTGLKGDLYRDGKVDVRDVITCIRRLLNKSHWYNYATGQLETHLACDVNGDGKDNVKDVIALMKYVLGEGDLDSYDNESYEYNKYLFMNVVSVTPWDVDAPEEHMFPLPAPLPTLELSEDKMSLVDEGIYWNWAYRSPEIHGGREYHGTTSEYWQDYIFVEVWMDVAEGDYNPEMYLHDPNVYTGGVLSEFYLQYVKPEDAGDETEQVRVRFAYLDPFKAVEKGVAKSY